MLKICFSWLISQEMSSDVKLYHLSNECYSELIKSVKQKLIKSLLKVRQVVKQCHYIIFNLAVRLQCNKEFWEVLL